MCLAGLVRMAVSSNTGRFGLSGFGWTFKDNTSATTSA
jgi:hypothetical protein